MKKLSFFIILFAILSFILVSCQKEPSNPLETTLSSSNPPALMKTDTHTENESSPFWEITNIPCAAGGAGEDVKLSGIRHELAHWITKENGGFVLMFHIQLRNLTGVGLTTGDKYHGTNISHDVSTNGKIGHEYTFIYNFRLIRQGTDKNYLVHETFHYRVNWNGTMTSYVDNYKVDCK